MPTTVNNKRQLVTMTVAFLVSSLYIMFKYILSIQSVCTIWLSFIKVLYLLYLQIRWDSCNRWFHAPCVNLNKELFEHAKKAAWDCCLCKAWSRTYWVVSFIRLKTKGYRAFSVAAPRLWNSRPPHIRSCNSLGMCTIFAENASLLYCLQLPSGVESE